MNATEFIDELRERFPAIREQSQLWWWLEKAITSDNAGEFLARLSLCGSCAGDEANLMTWEELKK